jgi:hypothetical protein
VVRPKNFERTCDDDSAGKKFEVVSEEQLSQLIATLKRILDFELDEAEKWEMKAGEVLRQGPAQADDRPLDERKLLLCSKGQNALRMAFAGIPILLGWHSESGFAGAKRQFTCSCTITSKCDSIKVGSARMSDIDRGEGVGGDIMHIHKYFHGY